MLKKSITFDHSVTETGSIQVRRITRIMEDGKEISVTYHRHVVSPGNDYADQDERTRAIARVVHTPETVAAYLATQTTGPAL